MFNDKDKAWRILMFLPIILLVISIGFLMYNVSTTGEFIERDIELKGGKQITIEIQTSLTSIEINDILNNKGFEVNARLLSGLKDTLLIETGLETDTNELLKSLEEDTELNTIGEPNIREVGPKLSEQFFQQTQTAIIVAFIFMAIIVFIIFRSVVPSLAVIFAAATDIIVTLAIMSFLHIPLSLSLLAGLLLLIGYSIDTDILLTSRVLKHHEDSLKKRITSAVKTGLTMTSTTIAALLALFFLSGNITLQTIAVVLLIGLIVDVPTTWLTNVGILRIHMLRKHGSDEE
ncbi:preprotein translocase subunit SecF [archaeon]|nr:preprotein translocase subunit SecF [archaeon]|tara:strand:+ start:305 stop:1174 length:870 start_codon:yes stop_codon:yes gene_type:complete